MIVIYWKCLFNETRTCKKRRERKMAKPRNVKRSARRALRRRPSLRDCRLHLNVVVSAAVRPHPAPVVKRTPFLSAQKSHARRTSRSSKQRSCEPRRRRSPLKLRVRETNVRRRRHRTRRGTHERERRLHRATLVPLRLRFRDDADARLRHFKASATSSRLATVPGR